MTALENEAKRAIRIVLFSPLALGAIFWLMMCPLFVAAEWATGDPLEKALRDATETPRAIFRFIWTGRA